MRDSWLNEQLLVCVSRLFRWKYYGENWTDLYDVWRSRRI